MHPTRENEQQGLEKALDMVPEPRNAEKGKIRALAPLGLVTLVYYPPPTKSSIICLSILYVPLQISGGCEHLNLQLHDEEGYLSTTTSGIGITIWWYPRQ